MSKECIKWRGLLLLLLLAGAVLSGCLSASGRVSESKKFEVTAVNTETNVLQTAYETSSYSATPNGFYEKGVLRIKNSGNTTLGNVQLKLRVKNDLSPRELDVMAHADKDNNLQPRMIQDVAVSPGEVFIEHLGAGETRDFTIDLTGFGEGNFYGIEVVYNNTSIFGIQGFVPNIPPSTSEDFTAEELVKMPAEQLAMIVPDEVLERFTAQELARFTSDELAHIIPSKFHEKNTSPFEPVKPIEILSAKSKDTRHDDLVIWLETEPEVKQGGILQIKLKIKNIGTKSTALLLGGLPPKYMGSFDFIVTMPDGTEVWKWSHDKVFLTVLSEFTLEPGRALEFLGEWNLTNNSGEVVLPGTYLVKGIFEFEDEMGFWHRIETETVGIKVLAPDEVGR